MINALVEFHPAHIQTMFPRLREMDKAAACLITDAGLSDMDSRWSHTLVVGGTPVACGGFVPLWDGVAEAWMLTTDAAQRYPLLLARTARSRLQKCKTELNLRRVQTVVNAEFEAGIRWAHFMGFRHEGVMARFGPSDEDFIRYAWVRGMH